MVFVSKYDTLALDLGDVFFFYSGKTDTSVSPFMLKGVVESPIWYDYECAKISRQSCLQKIEEVFDIRAGDFEETLRQAALSLTCNTELVEAVKDLKTKVSGLRVIAMSNTATQDYEILRPYLESWDVFDQVVLSSKVGYRKPDLSFYRHAIKSAQVVPEKTVFVDDKCENVITAHSLGMHGVVYENTQECIAKLQNLFLDPVKRGEEFLRRYAKKMWCVSATGVQVQDIFAQMIIFHATMDRSLVELGHHTRTWNVFFDKPVLTDSVYPDDLDTTSLALYKLDGISSETKHSVMNEMLQYLTVDGFPQTYFDPQRPRFDPFVCANVLRLFYQNGRGQELTSTLTWLYSIVLTRGYEFGTRYYHLPDWFFYYLGDLCAKNSKPELEELRELLRCRLAERFGCTHDPMSAALRVLAAQSLGLENDRDLIRLLSTQLTEGGWENGEIYRYGRSGIKFLNSGVITALAVQAIKNAGDYSRLLDRV